MLEFNLNNLIYVQITPYGIAELKRQHEENRKYFPAIGDFVPPVTDEEGFSQFQMYEFMNRFGHLMKIGNSRLPVEFNVRFKKYKKLYDVS